MRLVSYNIMNDGEGRADPLAEILLAQRADIVVLFEAQNSEVLERIASRLNMDFFHARGPENAAAILSRWPMTQTIDYGALMPEISRSFFEANVLDPSSWIWNIACIDMFESNVNVAAILDVFQARRAHRSPQLLAGNIPPPALSKIIAAGYSDPVQTMNEQGDRILTFGIEPEQIRATWIELDRLAKYASDHFPIGIEIE